MSSSQKWAELEADALKGDLGAVRVVVSALRKYRKVAQELRADIAYRVGDAGVDLERIDYDHLEGR